jgi:hypothetical protein
MTQAIMVGKFLGHTQMQSIARYAHLMADPVRQAAGQVAESIAARRRLRRDN